MNAARWAGLTGLLTGAVLIVSTAPLAAQTPVPVFDRLQGAWVGEGRLMDRAARFTMTWEQHGDLAILRFSNAFVDPSGRLQPVLSAAAIYGTTRDRPQAVWLDTRGMTIHISWTATDSALVANWAAPDEAGRTTYQVVSADLIEVIDQVRSRDAWRTFGSARYRRSH